MFIDSFLRNVELEQSFREIQKTFYFTQSAQNQEPFGISRIPTHTRWNHWNRHNGFSHMIIVPYSVFRQTHHISAATVFRRGPIDFCKRRATQNVFRRLRIFGKTSLKIILTPTILSARVTDRVTEKIKSEQLILRTFNFSLF